MNAINWKEQIINLVAMFIGVYAAFGLTNYQAAKDETRREIAILQDIQSDLREDATYIDSELKRIDHNIQNNQRLDALLHGAEVKISADSLSLMMKKCIQNFEFFPKQTGFKRLSVSNVYLDNVELHARLLEIYDFKYHIIQKYVDYDESTTNDGIITFLAKYSTMPLGKQAVSVEDLTISLNNENFFNLMHLQNFRHGQLRDLYTESLKNIHDIIGLIDEEVSRLKS